MKPDTYHIEEQPSYEVWDEIRPALYTRLTDAGMNDADTVSFLVAVEEIYMNVVMHGFPDGISDGSVCALDLGFSNTGNGSAAVITVRDNGIAFDPLGHIPKEPVRSARGVDPGGFGIRMAKDKTDLIEYRRDGDYNQLIMTRYFNGRGDGYEI